MPSIFLTPQYLLPSPSDTPSTLYHFQLIMLTSTFTPLLLIPPQQPTPPPGSSTYEGKKIRRKWPLLVPWLSLSCHPINPFFFSPLTSSPAFGSSNTFQYLPSPLLPLPSLLGPRFLAVFWLKKSFLSKVKGMNDRGIRRTFPLYALVLPKYEI